MRTREMKYQDYYMSKEDVKIVLDYISGNDPDKEQIFVNALESTNSQISKYLYKAMSEHLSFEKLNQTENIPIDIKDFYGYRRKAIYKIFELMKMYSKVE